MLLRTARGGEANHRPQQTTPVPLVENSGPVRSAAEAVAELSAFPRAVHLGLILRV